MRLQKYLALCGVASRRKCEEMMLAGRVLVNGEIADTLGMRVAEGDEVKVDGSLVRPEAVKRYILYHKPMGEISTSEDPEGRATVLDRFKEFPERLYPVGRLDFDSEGLLLLTNDGELCQRLLHPSHEVDKVYLARVDGSLSGQELAVLQKGVTLDGYQTSASQVRVIRSLPEECVCLVSIHEGRNRQVRRMFEAVGHRVLMLRRVQFGPLQLGGLARGQWRELTQAEVDKLREL